MFANVSRGIPGERLEDAIRAAKYARGVSEDTGLTCDALRELSRSSRRSTRETPTRMFPGPAVAAAAAIRAVFDSWLGERAVAYRRLNHIPDDWGTAVNVQQMVFGNKGDTSGSGVAFSRDEVTGAPEPSGDFLPTRRARTSSRGAHPADIADV